MKSRLLLPLACLLAILPTLAGGRSNLAVDWSEWEKGRSDVRQGVFRVGDPACAYTTMADPFVMGKVVPHLEGVTVHTNDGSFQDVTLSERFWPVGLVESRYHRNVDGSGRLEWKLVEGRQAKHDGHWQVHADGRVVFQNELQAKNIIHRALLRRIQVHAMEGVASSVQEHCGS